MTIEIDDETYTKVEEYQKNLKGVSMNDIIEDSILIGMFLILSSHDPLKIIACIKAAAIINHNHRNVFIEQQLNKNQQSTSA